MFRAFGGTVETKDDVRKRLLTPISDEEAAAIVKLVTREELEAALQEVDRELRPLENYARNPAYNPSARYN